MTNSNVVNGPGTGLFVDGNENVGPSPRTPLLEGNLSTQRHRYEPRKPRLRYWRHHREHVQQQRVRRAPRRYPKHGDRRHVSRPTVETGSRPPASATSVPIVAPRTRTSPTSEFNANGIDSAGAGISFSATQAPRTTSTNEAHQNNIEGNATGARYLGTEAVNVESNWWGSPTGPTHSGNPGGQGTVWTIPRQPRLHAVPDRRGASRLPAAAAADGAQGSCPRPPPVAPANRRQEERAGDQRGDQAPRQVARPVALGRRQPPRPQEGP